MKFSKCLGFAVLVAACADAPADGPLTWEEFKDRAYQDPETGSFVYDGDQTAYDEVDLGRAYDAYRNELGGEGTIQQGLIVNVYNGAIDKWADATAVTYCVSKKSFGSRYNQIVADVAAALDAWRATGANISYTHVVAEDNSCSNRSNVTFNVKQDRSTQYYAKAFFPYYPRRYREVVISTISYNPANLGPWTLQGILKHELGHTLGFRHEHIRPENLNRVSPCSTEDSNWSPLTEYDSASVMHYPHNGCAGTNTGDLDITALDAQGARTLYP
jgi:serralysin